MMYSLCTLLLLLSRFLADYCVATFASSPVLRTYPALVSTKVIQFDENIIQMLYYH